MTMWLVIMWTVLAVTVGAFVYVCSRLKKLPRIQKISENRKFKKNLVCILITAGFFSGCVLCFDVINAMVCLLYLALILGLVDFIFYGVQKIFKKSVSYYLVFATAFFITVGALTAGWHFNHHVRQTSYFLKTPKNVPDMKIIMFADSHIGTTFDADGFERHLQTIQNQNPDAILIVGDFVDDDTNKENMEKSVEALGKMKTKYGVFFVSGNHDKGYGRPERRGYGGFELLQKLRENGIKVLKDESVLVADAFYFVGRRDFSEEKERKGRRKSMNELIENLNRDKYILVLDHQPADYEHQIKAEVDLVLSGHTHGGQLFPFNYVGKWIGANDKIYGHEKRQKTDFIVTSGISDWAIKFKTGTYSEYVVIHIQKSK